MKNEVGLGRVHSRLRSYHFFVFFGVVSTAAIKCILEAIAFAVAFDDLAEMVEAVQGCPVKGLAVTVDILDKVYQTDGTCVKGFKKTMKLLFDKTMPKWKYRAMPQLT